MRKKAHQITLFFLALFFISTGTIKAQNDSLSKQLNQLNNVIQDNNSSLRKFFEDHDRLMQQLINVPEEKRNTPEYQDQVKKQFELFIQGYLSQKETIELLVSFYLGITKMKYSFTDEQRKQFNRMKIILQNMIFDFNENKEKRTQSFDLLFPPKTKELQEKKKNIPADILPLT